MITVPVPLSERSYEVHIGTPSLDEITKIYERALGKTSGVAVLVDGQLAQLSPRAAALTEALGKRFPGCKTYRLPAGEAAKSLAEVERTCQWLAENGFDRGASLIAIGGGATSDHVGFVAAIYLRGVQFAVCSTTVLGMVDASVGGKTGVDLPAGKNLVGAFFQPKAVIADLGFLATLPRREQAAGLAEVVKAGLIADADLLAQLEAEAAADRVFTEAALLQAIAAAVRVKVDVVVGDERESGRRAILNFGHTVGHALESESAYALLHGEAVSLGMVAALAFGRARGLTAPELETRATALLSRIGLPVDVARRVNPAVLARIEVDKKRAADRLKFVFVPHAGEALLQDVALTELQSTLPAALAGAAGGGGRS
ncbi:MAG TPA: 3-dehydroquinate synthase [Polyangia bacterium]